MAEVVLARRARAELLELGWLLIDAVEDAPGLLARAPHRRHELRGRLRGLRSPRVGSYRVIYQLSADEKTGRVAAIRHRHGLRNRSALAHTLSHLAGGSRGAVALTAASKVRAA